MRELCLKKPKMMFDKSRFSVGYTFPFLKKLMYLFSFGCVGSSLLHTGFSLVVASRGYSSLWCAGFSLQWLLLLRAWALGTRASVVVARGLSSCGMWAQ